MDLLTRLDIKLFNALWNCGFIAYLNFTESLKTPLIHVQAIFICLLIPFLSNLWGIPFSQLPNYFKDGSACFLNIGTMSKSKSLLLMILLLYFFLLLFFNLFMFFPSMFGLTSFFMHLNRMAWLIMSDQLSFFGLKTSFRMKKDLFLNYFWRLNMKMSSMLFFNLLCKTYNQHVYISAFSCTQSPIV